MNLNKIKSMSKKVAASAQSAADGASKFCTQSVDKIVRKRKDKR